MKNSLAYDNSAHVGDDGAYAAKWTAGAEAFRAEQPSAELGVAYGDGERLAFDLFHPEGTARGTVIFVHGGYWRSTHRSLWSHLATGPLAHGWRVAMPSYDLCPTVTIPEITAQIARAVEAIAAHVEGPLRLTGHSAGGHLVARMCAPGMLPEPVRARIERVVPISPLADLAPLIETDMNADLRLDPTVAEAESPMHQPAPEMPVTVWVGGGELPAFLDQARWLGAAWGVDWVADGALNHFSVVEELENPSSDLTLAVLG